MSATAVPVPVAAPAPRRRGFTLVEVLIALSLLLVGGVSVLSVFALAASHVVARQVERGLDLARPEALRLAQEAVDKADRGRAPAPVVDAPTADPFFTVSVDFVRSPHGDAAWVALMRVTYRGESQPRWALPPAFLYRKVY